MSKIEYTPPIENENIEEAYQFPYEVFKKTFGTSDTGLFNEVFSTFDITKEEALYFVKTIGKDPSKYIFIESCLFDLTNYENYLYGREFYVLSNESDKRNSSSERGN